MSIRAVESILEEDSLFFVKKKKLLEEIKRSRQTFDTSETEKNFGPITILYAQVQSSVTHKYDYWHKDVLKKFGTKLADEMRAFHVRVCIAIVVRCIFDLGPPRITRVLYHRPG